jgi:hypothetical protein
MTERAAGWVACMVGVCMLFYGWAFAEPGSGIEYTPSNYSVKVSLAKAVVVQKIRDARGVEANVVIQKRVRYSSSGRFFLNPSVADFLTGAIKEVLTRIGYKVVSTDGDYTLSGELLKFESYPISGYWTGAKEATLMADMKLTDSRTKNVVWHELISGVERLEDIDMREQDDRKEVTEKALDNFMKKIARSGAVKSFLEVPSGNP